MYRSAVFTLLLAVLAGCGPAAPSTDDPTPNPFPDPHPLQVSYVLEESQAVQQPVTIDGGNLSATGSDGTRYTLTIPPDALIEDAEIKMTPITRVSGFALEGGAVAGIKLEPEGLRLFNFATLTVTPPGGAAVPAAGFASKEGGEDFHLYPLVLDPEVLSLKLMHFSEVIVYYGDGIYIPIDPDAFVPVDLEAQLEHQIAEVIQHERDAQIMGEESDPEATNKLEALLDAYYNLYIEPMLPKIASDCKYGKANVGKAVAWVRQVELMGFGERFAQESDAIGTARMAGLENCWKEMIGECFDPSNEAQVTEARILMRTFQLLGADPDAHDPFDPELTCRPPEASGTASWSSTYTFENNPDWFGEGTDNITSSGYIWLPDEEASHDGMLVYKLAGVTMTASGSSSYTQNDDRCTYSYEGSATLDLNPPDPNGIEIFSGGLSIDTVGADSVPPYSYYGGASAVIEVDTQTSCEKLGSWPGESAAFVALFETPNPAVSGDPAPVMTEAGVVSGSYSGPAMRPGFEEGSSFTTSWNFVLPGVGPQ